MEGIPRAKEHALGWILLRDLEPTPVEDVSDVVVHGTLQFLHPRPHALIGDVPPISTGKEVLEVHEVDAKIVDLAGDPGQHGHLIFGHLGEHGGAVGCQSNQNPLHGLHGLLSRAAPENMHVK